jgi:hypothetical protein
LTVPAEGIHLSALDDLIATGPARCVSRLSAGARREAARLGSVLVDLPYFESFAMAVANYLLRRPQRTSPWGDTMHHTQPIAVGRRLMAAGFAALRAAGGARGAQEQAELVIAFALGYIAHAAVDRSMHPLVNYLAQQRSLRTGRRPDQEHHEVEKYQSILFHEDRFGIDMMGRLFLYNYLDIDFTLLCGRRGQAWGPLWPALYHALHKTHGIAPTLADFRRWTGSFDDYRLILTSPLGATLVPDYEKLFTRPALYDAVRFPRRYQVAVGAAGDWADALLSYGLALSFEPRNDTSAETALQHLIPEGSIDPGPSPDTAALIC